MGLTWLKLRGECGPEGHETADSVRRNALEDGFHGVVTLLGGQASAGERKRFATGYDL